VNLTEALRAILQQTSVNEVVDSLVEGKGTPAEQIAAAIDYLKREPGSIKNWDNVYLLLRKYAKNLIVKVRKHGTFYMYGSHGSKSSIMPVGPIQGYSALTLHRWPAKTRLRYGDTMSVGVSRLKQFASDELLDLSASK